MITSTSNSNLNLHVTGPDSLKNQGFVDSIIAKIVNNFQVTVKNIHVRYEDNVSVPGVSVVHFRLQPDDALNWD